MELWLYKVWLCRDLESGKYPKRKPAVVVPIDRCMDKPVGCPLLSRPDLCELLRSAIGEAEFGDWFDVKSDNPDRVLVEEERVILELQSRYRIDYLIKNHEPEITAALGRPVEYRIAWVEKELAS